MKAIAVFLATAAVDALWSRYIWHTAQHRAWPAACYSAGIVLSGAVTTVAIVADNWMVIPAALGAFAGTFLAVRR